MKPRAGSQSYPNLNDKVLIWSPISTFHDPNPPITIEDQSLSDTVDESSNANATQTATAVINAVYAEQVVVAEASVATKVVSDTVSESLTATESSDATVVVAGETNSESATATESPTVTAILNVTCSESSTASDSCMLETEEADIAESVTAMDQCEAFLIHHNIGPPTRTIGRRSSVDTIPLVQTRPTRIVEII